MARATWRGAVLAESSDVRVSEGNTYFPPDSLNAAFFRESRTRTRCPWKGVASYYDIVVGDHVNRDAAWVYPETTPKAEFLRGYVAFWRGVSIE